MGKRTKNKNGENIKIAAGVIGLFILFAAASAAFYVNRDAIYAILRGGAKQNGAAQKTPRQSQSPGVSGASDPFGPFDPFEPFEPFEFLDSFGNTVFLGDSIVSGIEFCKDSAVVGGEKVLKEAEVVAAVGYSLKNAVSDISGNAVNLTYEGKPMRPEDIVARLDKKHVFICLGLNDLSGMSVDEYIENYGRLVENIRAKSPEKSIAILSVTPLVAGQRGGLMTNRVISEANGRLREFAYDNDMYFFDWASAIRDENGALYGGLSSDGYCHLKAEAYGRLAEYLAGSIIG